MRLHIGVGSLDGNHHIMERYPDGLKLDGMSHRFRVKRGPSAMVVVLGRDSMSRDGRTLVGRRLWLYAPSGRCWSFDIGVRFDRTPYPSGHRYGPVAEGAD